MKNSKINFLIAQYEKFEMFNNESIGDMFHWLNIIVTSLKLLGKEFTIVEQVQKILRILPQSSKAKVTAIREAMDLEILQIDQLMGFLLTHEIERKGPPTITPEEAQKKKCIALKASTSNEVYSSDSSSSSNEDLTIFSRKFKKFFRRKQARHKPKRSFQQRREHSSEERREGTCYNCKKLGHIKAECPKLQERHEKKKYKKKVMAATWNNSEESSSSSKGEHAHMCFMAYTHENKVISFDFDSNSLSYNELEHEFRKLVKAYDKLSSKHDKIRKLNVALNDEMIVFYLTMRCLNLK